MTTVIFVHGISNMPAKDDLIQYWRNILATDHAGNPGLDLTVRARIRSVHWADVLYTAPLSMAQVAENAEMSLESAGALATGGPDLSDVSDDYLQGLAAAMDIDPDELAAADTPAAPPDAALAEAAAEALPLPWFLKKPLMRAAARDSHHYLFNVDHSPRPGETFRVRDEVRARFVTELQAAAQSGPIILLTHSMGTVIAYDCLKNVAECPGVKHYMTVGSPLGITEMQDNLKPGYTRHDGFPHEKVEFRWVNIYDPVDIVSRADARLRGDYLKNGGEMVEDLRQNNGGLWTHSMSRYLAEKPLRDALRSLF